MIRSINRLRWLVLMLFVPLMALAIEARAHHGWGWASAEEFEISGVITAARLGNPHGELTLDVEGESWTIEVGQPWRNERAGLTDEMLSIGTSITVHGQRSSRQDERLVKAEWVMIDGTRHVLYPERRS